MLVHSDSRSVVSYINHQGSLVSKRLCIRANDLLVWADPEQSALTEGDACAGRDEPWSRHVKEQRLLRGMDAPPASRFRKFGKSVAELE